MKEISEGLTDAYQSTGTLSRILQQGSNEDFNSDEEEFEPAEGAERRSKGPRLDRVLEDDDFLSELRLRNEHLLK